MSEALSLDWADVDLAHHRALLRDTKSGADRAVDLCPRAVSVLCQSTGRVFRTNAGEPDAEHRDLLLLRYVGGWASVTLVERYAHLVPSSLARETVDWRAASDTFLTRPDAARSGKGGKPLI